MKNTIKTHQEIKLITKLGKKEVSKYFLLFTLDRNKFEKKRRAKYSLDEQFNYAILISKKFGKAHERNRAKRRIRAVIYSYILKDIKKRNNEVYVFIPRYRVMDCSFEMIKNEAIDLLTHRK